MKFAIVGAGAIGAFLGAMLARAGGFALPSRAEGSGLSYLRAMRAAVPCIAGADDAVSAG